MAIPSLHFLFWLLLKNYVRMSFDTVVNGYPKCLGMMDLKLISFIRNELKVSRIPILVLSGLDDSQLKSQVLNLGVTDFLNKPIQCL